MGIVIGILVGVVVLVGSSALVAMAAAGRVAREGRGDGHLLVAPRGAGFGAATLMVREAAQSDATPGARVVHLDDHRAHRTGSAHEAA